MAFNAENLFDTADDPDNPGDDSYLPLAVKDLNRAQHDANCERFYGRHVSFLDQCKSLNWSDQAYSTKLRRLGDVINAMQSAPEVIVFQEVETRRVLDDLVGRHLAGAGYRVIQLDTSDKVNNRGIDVGILTRLDLAGVPAAHRIAFGEDEELCNTVRDIVHAPLRLPGGEALHVFGVHFSPFGDQLPCRIRAFERLNQLVATLPPHSLAIAAGDFNFNCDESASDEMARLLADGNWYAPPLVRHGCSPPGSFRDLSPSSDGSHRWSFLDMILVSAELNPTMPSTQNWFADLGSFTTAVVHPEQVRVDDKGHVAPRWFDPASGRGVSDHWPVAIRLMTRRN